MSSRNFGRIPEMKIISSVDEVKRLSPNHRLEIALHSPREVAETGLP